MTIVGQLLTPKERLLEAFRNAARVEDLIPLLELDDNYAAAYQSGAHVWIVNSIYSFNSYFYSLASDQFFHGETIADVASQGAVDLSWDHEALADMLALGHLVGEESLARGVRPVAQGEILHWDGARLDRWRGRWRDLAPAAPSPSNDVASDLIDLFLKGLEAGVSSRPIATSSSGLDSRVILAGLLHLGMRPDLLVMGDPQSKDVAVVRQMAAAFGLPLNHVELETREYVERATEICRLTNGVKPVDHWHSYFLASKSGYTRDDHVMTGNNGEHVRAAGFDYGLLAVGLDQLSRHDGHLISDALLARLWRMKSHVVLRPDEMRRCAPAFAGYYGSRRQTEKLMSVMPPDESFVWQSDAFVLQQRRRVFQACGLRLMSVHFFPYSPYMRKPWVDAAWRLGLSWRLGSRWHRHVVERLCPALLAFPEEKEARHMLRRQRPLAWAPYVKKIYRRPSAVPYMNYAGLLRNRDVVGMLSDHASQLDDVIPKAVVDGIVDEQLRTGTRARLVAVLTSMAVWRAAVRVAPAAQRPVGGQAARGAVATSGAA